MNNNKIVICHIAHKLTGKSDGVFKHLLLLFELLDNTKYNHILIYSGNDHNINSLLMSKGIKVYKVLELNKKISFKAFRKLLNIIKQENAHIVQAHLVKPYFLAALANIFLMRKLIFNYHGAFLDETFYNSLERIILRKIHKIIINKNLVDIWIFPSNKLCKDVLSKYKLNIPSKVYYNGFIPLTFFSNKLTDNFFEQLSKLKEKFFLVGIIGRIDEWKRVDIALKILQQLLQNNIEVFFTFIGDGEKFEEMVSLAENMKLDKRTLFQQFIPDVWKKLKIFDLILITSELEGFPLTIWEAMYNGVPVVSSDVGGIKEILEGENCGIVYPFGDVQACSNIINELMNKKDKLIELGNNGRKAILEKYNQKQFKEFFENLYSDLMNEK